MGLESKPYYWIECDHPGCGEKSTEGGDFSAWSDVDGAETDAECSDFVKVGSAWFCGKHVPASEE